MAERVGSGRFVPTLTAAILPCCGHPLSAVSAAGALAATFDHRAQCLACQDTPAGRLSRSLTAPLAGDRANPKG
jgi:hypothetical protein